MENGTNSYIELCFHLDGQENVYLRVPTVWDGTEKQHIGFIKTPVTNRLISGHGKTSRDLELSFTKSMQSTMQESEALADEIFGMFMPAWYWEK